MGVVCLSEALDVELYGKKANSLAQGILASMPVPPGFVLSAEAVEAFLKKDAQVCHTVEKLFAELNSAVSVRSSAIDEDSDSASFAGQHLTLLNIQKSQELYEAIASVRNSACSESAIEYRKKLGLSLDCKMSIIVQKLVDADCSGVLFTKDPVGSSDDVVMEASWGLGEAVVEGLVIPDRYRLDREGTVLEKVVGKKDVAIRPSRKSSGVEKETLPEQLARSLCLNDIHLAKLFHMARECEQIFGKNRDIEWAIKSNRLYLLQCRSITPRGLDQSKA